LKSIIHPFTKSFTFLKKVKRIHITSFFKKHPLLKIIGKKRCIIISCNYPLQQGRGQHESSNYLQPKKHKR
jgi:hypothetical protein